MTAAEQGTFAFETKDLSKAYGYVKAVDSLTVSVRGGSIGLLGPNGAGKSTLLKTLLGLIRPTGGTFSVMGLPSGGPYLDRIGYMPEHDCLPGGLTAVGLVSYMGQLSGLPADVSMERAHDILDFVGLDESRYRKIKSFSTGMKQKVKLSQALVHDPDILFFDEPTNGLDPEGRKEMLDLIRDVSGSKKTIILSTHLLPDVEYVCDDVMIMNNGCLVLYDSLKVVLGSQHFVVRVKGNKEAFFDELSSMGLEPQQEAGNIIVPGNAPSSALFKAASRSNSQIRYLSQHSRTLEELFLKMVGDEGE